MNTCAQPAEGAGGSRSRAAGELTLGLMSGEKRGVRRSAFALLWARRCGDPTCSRRRPASRPESGGCTLTLWELACLRWRSVSQHQCQMCRPLRGQARSHRFGVVRIIGVRRKYCGSGLARDSGLPVDQEHHRRTHPATRPAGRPPRTLLRCTPPREAERRFCAVGNPAWMPG